jgi:hypothetical protein
MGVKLSLTLKREYKQRVFENMVLRKIFVPKRDEVTGDWRKLHNEDPHGLYSSPNIWVFKSRIEMDGVCGTMEERRGAYRVLVGKPERKRPLRRPRRRW